MRVAAAASAVLIAATGCDGDEVACAYDAPYARPTSNAEAACASARQLAARDAAGFFVTQPELDRYRDMLERSFEPLAPILGHPPAAQRWESGPTVTTAVEPIARAWTAGWVGTGVAALDAITAAAGIDTVQRAPGSDIYLLSASRRTLVPAHVVAAIAAAALPGVAASSETGMLTTPGEEITLEAPLSAAVVPVRFQIGWGDCLSGCFGQHFWRVDLTATTATLRDEWGAPIPPEVLDAYRRWPEQ